jgi:hypothetical protein
MLNKSLVRIRKDDASNIDLPCTKDCKGNIISVFDYRGNKLVHNPDARTVIYKNLVWYY